MPAPDAAAAPARPRVVLVDDDASIRRLVALALEDLDIELLAVATVEQALAALRAGPARLIVTDLMMPGATGFDLLQRLAEEPALRAGARLAVYSAGLNAATRAQLAELDVWRALDKPVSVQLLEACVVEALGSPAPAPQPDSRPQAGGEPLEGGERNAVAELFGGDLALFLAFKAGAQAQFGADLAEGDRVSEAGELAALRRLAHSLKGVLMTLGHDAAAHHARRLELLAAAGDTTASRAAWADLRAALRPLAARNDDGSS
jgi:CheY-like chemotaxis protein